MHQNSFFFFFETSTSKPLKNTKNSVNLMVFPVKHTFKTHLKVETTALPNIQKKDEAQDTAFFIHVSVSQTPLS